MSKASSMILEGIDVSLPPAAFSAGCVPRSAIRAACKYLGMFVTRQANLTADLVGFSWIGQEDAPDTFDDLSAAFDLSAETGEPLPISNMFCETSIYPTIETNIALRFWHDTHHVLRSRNFSHAQEIDMALWHLEVAATDGVARGSVAWRLLEGDMLGQTLCSATLGRFPIDQFLFDLNCMHFGIADALVIESEHDVPLLPGRLDWSATVRDDGGH